MGTEERLRQLQHRQENLLAQAAPAGRAWPETRPDGRCLPLGMGVARITSVDDASALYTITQQLWDQYGFDDAEQVGLVEKTARDYRLRTTGQIDQIVTYWMLPNRRGGMDVWIDVSREILLELIDSDEQTFGQIESLRLDGENGLRVWANQSAPGCIEAQINLPDGVNNAVGGGDLLVWIEDQARPGGGFWSTVAFESVPSAGVPLTYYIGPEGPGFAQPHIMNLSVGGSQLAGVSSLSLDVAEPLEIAFWQVGDDPEKAVDVVISHKAPFASAQSVTVRDAAGTGTVTLEFDQFGHFTGTS
ncbi:MAG: hypothetical protein ACLFUJ_03020 [Phycisphaerae bacterium]